MKAFFKTFLAGIGILSDAFNLFSINLVKNVMAIQYPQTQGQTSLISSAALAGAIVGQLVFGSLADRLGRRAIFITTISLVIVGALGSATVVQSSVIDIYTQLALWLLLLGFGIGGEYPLSASVSSEGSSHASRGRAVGTTFAMQGVGNLMASLIMFILLKSSLPMDWVWRVALGAGALPGLLTVYWRWKMEESSHYLKLTGPDGTAAVEGAAAADRDAEEPGNELAIAPVHSAASSATVTAYGTSLPGTSSSRAGSGAGGAGAGDDEHEHDAGVSQSSPLLANEQSSPAKGRSGAADSSASSSSAAAAASAAASRKVNPLRAGLPRSYSAGAAPEEAGYGSGAAAYGGVHGGSPADSERLIAALARSGPIPQAALPSPAASPALGSAAGGRAGSGSGSSSGRRAPPSCCARMCGPFKSLAATIWEFRWLLLGTAGSWLLFDIVFYANGEFSGSVLEDMGWSHPVNKSALGLAPAVQPQHRLLTLTASAAASSASSSADAVASAVAGGPEAGQALLAAAGAGAAAVADAAGVAAAAVSSALSVGGAALLRGRSLLRALAASTSAAADPSQADPLAAVGGAAGLLGTEQGVAAAKDALAGTALGNLILALIGLPGYVVAVLVIDRVGRRNLQLIGFTAVTVIYVILAATLAPLTQQAALRPLLLVFYGLSFFFLNVGPNTTTFVIPAECFPTRAKATCHGISAASGKLGAVIGAAMMSPLLDWYGSATDEAKRQGLSLVLYACAAVSVAGLLWTFAFTHETGTVTIEDLDRFGVTSFRKRSPGELLAPAPTPAGTPSINRRTGSGPGFGGNGGGGGHHGGIPRTPTQGNRNAGGFSPAPLNAISEDHGHHDHDDDHTPAEGGIGIAAREDSGSKLLVVGATGALPPPRSPGITLADLRSYDA